MRTAFAFAIVTMVFFAPTSHADADPLQRYAWNARLLVVVADNAEDADFVTQKADIAANADGYRDRDLVVFLFAGEKLVATQPQQDIDLDGTAMRKRLRLPQSGFATALIGLDTGVKLRSAEPIDACELFREIDGMPMRRQEIRAKGSVVTCRADSS